MNAYKEHLPTFAGLCLGLALLTAAPSASANMYSGPLDKSEWAAGVNVPSYIDMFIAVPDNMPEKPPILVNIHSCGNSAGGQWSYDGFAPLRDAIDSVGYIMIIPQQTRNCWNVGAPESLTHDGGGDTGAIVQMVKYVIEKYNADPTRVYAMGGSGGGMAVQALMAVYPEVFKGGHARAGVPAGCWAEGYDDGQQWSGACAGGSVNKTPQEWGDYVRAINPSYTGPRPRLQINQGDQDETISFNNFQEAIDEWTNVLGLDATPTTTDNNYQGAEATYNRQFWADACGYNVLETWEALGKGHSMGYESVHILEFFGLDKVRDQDPWDEACGSIVTGSTGTGGTTSTDGGTSAGGATSTSGVTSTSAVTSTDGTSTGAGGSTAVGGTASTTTGAGTTSTSGGMSGTVAGTTGPTATATTGGSATGSATGTSGTLTATSAGGTATGPSSQTDSDSGCSCTAAGGRGLPAWWMLMLAGLGLALGWRRRSDGAHSA